jgi:hypothetical protein
MSEYQKRLDNFTKYADKKRIKAYLEKYWLDIKELDDVWLPIKNDIYNSSFKMLPDPLFKEEFEVIILKGGLIFNRANFDALISCMKITGDKYFLILEDDSGPYFSGLTSRFKYPVNITWEEIMSGAELSMDVFQRPIRDIFVFGDSGQWGKYVADDHEYPLDLIGFNKRYSDLFHAKFKIPQKDVQDLKEWTSFYGMRLPGVE